MTKARSSVIKDHEVGIYHCYSRCVRRAFLCGIDRLTGCDYSHRRTWVQERLKELSNIFAVDVCGYAVMENHLHTVLRNRPDIAETWSAKEVAVRWRTLYPTQRDPQTQAPIAPKDVEIGLIADSFSRVQKYRKRLSSLSWFMRNTNEWVARRANAEDECKGHFWEGRFKSVALLDDASILSCTAYVELNPIHAGMAKTPEESDFTSIQDRIKARQAERHLKAYLDAIPGKPTDQQAEKIAALREQSERANWLCPLQDSAARKGFLYLDLDAYLRLVDWAGRQQRSDKAGSIPSDCAEILDRLQLEQDEWLDVIQSFDQRFYRVAGTVQNMVKAASQAGQKWFHGLNSARKLFKVS
ncbi:MAG: transposase [Acidobacteria bacterium]|nr:transposase [Acidobacteriota bacterium]MCB9399301.1 transposase [Acidobacteriota bacterium]